MATIIAQYLLFSTCYYSVEKRIVTVLECRKLQIIIRHIKKFYPVGYDTPMFSNNIKKNIFCKLTVKLESLLAINTLPHGRSRWKWKIGNNPEKLMYSDNRDLTDLEHKEERIFAADSMLLQFA